jgi:hypothetical protein
VSRRRSFGRCPHCVRTVWLDAMCGRPRSINAVAVHPRCYRLLTVPQDTQPTTGAAAPAYHLA